MRLAVENLLRQYRLTEEIRQLIETLSAKNQALVEMNRELEAKIHERTHELAESNSRLAQLAVTDGLTGLYNHRHLHERLALEVERSARNGLPLSLLMIDVDHFKHYNDHHGHPAGDDVLRTLARLLTKGRRANDMVARYGGEEFSVILVDTAKFTAAKLAERIREQVAGHPFAFGGQQPNGRELWERTWEDLTRTPSRLTAEPVNRAEREWMLEQARIRGYLDTYQGVRVTSTGRRFLVENAVIWNVVDAMGQRVGQAATFAHCTWLT